MKSVRSWEWRHQNDFSKFPENIRKPVWFYDAFREYSDVVLVSLLLLLTVSRFHQLLTLISKCQLGIFYNNHYFGQSIAPINKRWWVSLGWFPLVATGVNPLTTNVLHHIETSSLMSMWWGTLVVNRLKPWFFFVELM